MVDGGLGLRNMGVKEWRIRALERTEWVSLVREARRTEWVSLVREAKAKLKVCSAADDDDDFHPLPPCAFILYTITFNLVICKEKIDISVPTMCLEENGV
jgi:hypothetical protein